MEATLNPGMAILIMQVWDKTAAATEIMA